jgi:acetyltransferase-like isoleucine patch superfamily enzyme
MIHQSSDVQSKKIGLNTKVWQFCVILEGANIGEDCNINSHVFIENDVKIGNRVTIKSGVQLWDGISVEDDVFIGPNVTFTNDKFPRSKQYPEHFSKTRILKGASVGANCTILSNIQIGSFALIGAGSVVTKDVAPHALVIGNPAKQIGWVDLKGERLTKINDTEWINPKGDIWKLTTTGIKQA